jgi:predicted nucleotidyltransferase
MNYGLSEEQLNSIREIFSAHQEIEKGILFGSRAKGTHQPGSDIDIALVGEKVELGLILKILSELDSLSILQKFDLVVFHQIKSDELLDHINRVGIILYNKPESQ